MSAPTERARALAAKAHRVLADSTSGPPFVAIAEEMADVLEELAAECERLSAVIGTNARNAERDRTRLIEHGNKMIAAATKERDDARGEAYRLRRAGNVLSYEIRELADFKEGTRIGEALDEWDALGEEEKG